MHMNLFRDGTGGNMVKELSDFKKLNYFLALADELNFSKAAIRLSISQPTLSQYISKLEKEIGYELVDRGSSQIRLTPAGKIYAENLRIAMRRMDNALLKMNDIKGAASPLLIGTSPSICHYVLPSIIKKVREAYPDSPIHIFEGTTAELENSLDNDTIDMSLCVTNPDNSDYCKEVLYVEGILLAVSKSSDYFKRIESLSKNGNVSFVDVADFVSFITLQNDQVLTRKFKTLCEKYNVNPKNTISVTELSSAISMMQANLGATLIPGNLKKYVDGDNTAFYSFSELKNERIIAIHYKKEKHLTNISKFFIELMKKS